MNNFISDFESHIDLGFNRTWEIGEKKYQPEEDWYRPTTNPIGLSSLYHKNRRKIYGFHA
jgi:hypothetical protein